MNPAYLPKTTAGILAWCSEECAEVGSAISKTLRVEAEQSGGIVVALESGNPELAGKDFETNRDWILREIADLELAIAAVKKALS
jgi:hypothetical protein